MNLAGECRASSPDPHWEQIFFPALTWTEGSPQCCSRNRYCDPERTHDGKAEEESKKRAIKSRRFRYQNISIRSVSRPMRVMGGSVSIPKSATNALRPRDLAGYRPRTSPSLLCTRKARAGTLRVTLGTPIPSANLHSRTS